LKILKIEKFDSRRCELGEGPTARGLNNERITWVDILGKHVLGRNIETQDIDSFETDLQVGFALPALNSGLVIGIGDEIFLRDVSGDLQPLSIKCAPTNNEQPSVPVRWNDAKVAPGGELFAGSMDYQGAIKTAALYRIPKNHVSEIILSPVTISNGLDWNLAGDRFFYIDTPTFVVQSFEYTESGIADGTTFIELDQTRGMPDGMCADAEDGLWIAYFGGKRVERYSSQGKLTHTVEMPVSNPTSCCFAGRNLDLLIITSAKVTDEENPLSGMTFAVETGFMGQKNREFN
jgi:sugar lactone lactonase YvrE